jgi:hypothetical protein
MSELAGIFIGLPPQGADVVACDNHENLRRCFVTNLTCASQWSEVEKPAVDESNRAVCTVHANCQLSGGEESYPSGAALTDSLLPSEFFKL